MKQRSPIDPKISATHMTGSRVQKTNWNPHTGRVTRSIDTYFSLKTIESMYSLVDWEGWSIQGTAQVRADIQKAARTYGGKDCIKEGISATDVSIIQIQSPESTDERSKIGIAVTTDGV